MKLPSAHEMRLKTVMTDELDFALSDVKEKLFNGEEQFEVEIMMLDMPGRMALVDYLEFLGYVTDQSMGEDIIHVSYQ